MRACLFVMLAACGSSPAASIDAAVDGVHVDAAIDALVPMHVDDGTPTRQACTSQFGSALTATFGRLDGYLVAIVPPGGGPCNADSDHVHLQVKANGAIYDVAIDVTSPTVDDVHMGTRDLVMPGAAWSEGWHAGGLVDYPALGVRAADLGLGTKQSNTAALQTDLANANHISVFATGYGPDGAHLVHRNGHGHDGLIITDPLSTPAHLRFISFTSQAF